MNRNRLFQSVVPGFAAFAAVVCAQSDPAAASDVSLKNTAAAQAAAMAKYPALGSGGSDFNREFVARFRRYRTERPALFDDQQWPLKLADVVAQAGFVSGAEAGTGGIRLRDRTAVPPSDAPPKVLQAIEAGNALQTRGCKYGGGRDQLEDWG